MSRFVAISALFASCLADFRLAVFTIAPSAKTTIMLALFHFCSSKFFPILSMGHLALTPPLYFVHFLKLLRLVGDFVKVHLHTAINRADFRFRCMLKRETVSGVMCGLNIFSPLPALQYLTCIVHWSRLLAHVL